MAYVSGASADALAAENVLAKVRVIVNVLRGTTGHVDSGENSLVQLVLNFGAEILQAPDDLVLFLDYTRFMLLLLQTSAHSLTIFQYLEVFPFQQG